jgi:oligopeptide/dipeptide ABC transporter ATP-binding protein
VAFANKDELNGAYLKTSRAGFMLAMEVSVYSLTAVLKAADEPTSMLDVSVRAGIMQLMQGLADRLGVTYLYITHDLAVARYMSTRLAVMYLGKIVEIGPTEEVLQRPVHPYTRALLAAVPVPNPSHHREAAPLKGGISKPVNPPARCRFYDRCPLAQAVCASEPHPPLTERSPGHRVACYVE